MTILKGRVVIALLGALLALETSALDIAKSANAELSNAELAHAESSSVSWSMQTSVWTTHFSPDPEHNNRQDLIGVERREHDDWLWGGAMFRNSFSQRSVYLYRGRQFDFAETSFYAKLTAGLLWGYRGEYRNKIPLNHLGIAPAILPSVGYRWKSVGAELVMFGVAGTMLNVGYHF